MFGKHIIRHLSAYHDGELSGAENRRIEAHLEQCGKCRAAYDEIRFGVRLASALSISNAPDSAWSDLHRVPRATQRRWIPRPALAGLLAVAVLLIVLLTETRRPAPPAWEVTGLPGTSRLRPGEVLQTDSSSEAQIKIANIGQLTMDPNTRIRLLVTQHDQHRIALDRGKVEATTWAPPRLFIVETPSATAVDLGCKYTLQVKEDGSSLLHVTLGLVALERDGGETIVPAGAFCRTRSGAGPGTPFFEDSSPQLQSALEQVDSLPEGPARTRQLEIVLREAHIRDGLSLWHLLPRVGDESRGLVYDRLAQLLPPPPEVTRDGVVQLDPKTLDAWKKVVSQLWQ
jgi:ferric-dicitrate binding protein FerR (iron transport regulator)